MDLRWIMFSCDFNQPQYDLSCYFTEPVMIGGETVLSYKYNNATFKQIVITARKLRTTSKITKTNWLVNRGKIILDQKDKLLALPKTIVQPLTNIKKRCRRFEWVNGWVFISFIVEEIAGLIFVRNKQKKIIKIEVKNILLTHSQSILADKLRLGFRLLWRTV